MSIPNYLNTYIHTQYTQYVEVAWWVWTKSISGPYETELSQKNDDYSWNLISCEVIYTILSVQWLDKEFSPRSRSISRRVYPWTVPRRTRQTISRSLASIAKEAETDHSGEILVDCSTTDALKTNRIQIDAFKFIPLLFDWHPRDAVTYNGRFVGFCSNPTRRLDARSFEKQFVFIISQQLFYKASCSL